MTVVNGDSRRLLLGMAAALIFFFVGGLAIDARQAPSTAVAPPVTSPLATFDAAWSAIRETYVDGARSDEDWDRLHRRFRARAAAAATDAELRPVLRELLAAIGRSHFELLPSSLHDRLSAGAISDAGDLGLELTPLDGELIVTRVLPGSPGRAAGIEPGWVVETLDGVNAVELAGDVGPASAAEGAPSFRAWAAATALLKGPVGSRVQLRLRNRSDAPVQLNLDRVRQSGQPVKFGHLPTLFARLEERELAAPRGRRAHYIHFNIWMTAVSPAIDRAVAAAREADGIVLDLRQNPGGVLTMLMGISGHFLNDPISLGTLRTRDSELKLVANPRRVDADGRPVRPYAGKLAILVDSSSYSASEIFAAGMQAVGRARVFGSRSPGGALPAMLRRLPNGDVLEYAIGDFVTAADERIEGRGVVPDEQVPLTRRAVLAGEDPPLRAALEWIGRE